MVTITAPIGARELQFNQISHKCEEFVYTIAEDEHVTYIKEADATYGSYLFTVDEPQILEKKLIVNDGRWCEEEYTLRIIFNDVVIEDALRPLRGTVTMETDETGDQYLKVTIAEGKTAVGLYKDAIGDAIADVVVEVTEGNMIERTDAYVAYQSSNTGDVKGIATIHLTNGGEVTYDIVFDLGLGEGTTEPDAYDPIADLKVIRGTAALEGEDTVRLTMVAGKDAVGLYTTTKSGYTVTITDIVGVYDDTDRTDAFVAYKSWNTSNMTGTMVITTADGTTYEYKVIFDMGLGDEVVDPGEPEEPTFDIVSELKAIRGTVSAVDNTVTITVASGKTMTGIYNTTASGHTVEIKDANGTFADRTDAYVAYISSNTANVEGTMVVTLADGTVYEYAVIFDLGL